ncbi:MAG: hypothetical protein ACLFS6_07880 [Methanomassiliicoccales archaeon]
MPAIYRGEFLDMARKRIIKVRKKKKAASNEREDLPENYIDRGWSNC